MKSENNIMGNIKLFISHSSDDKKYGQAFVDLIRCLQVKRNQIIFTGVPGYGVPDGMNIFEYLKKQMINNVYILLLLSSNYYESVACLNEMGATWVLDNDYDIVFTPEFDFNNKKFYDSAIDNRKSVFNFNKQSLIILKNKIIQKFDLQEDEFDWNEGLEKFLEEIETIKSENKNSKNSNTIDIIDKEKLNKDCIDSIFKSFRDQDENIKITYKMHIESLEKKELDKEDLYEIWFEVDKQISNMSVCDKDKLKLFWEYVICNSNNIIQKSVLEYIKSEAYNFIKFYDIYPQVLKILLREENDISFKKDMLYTWINKTYITTYMYDYTNIYWRLVLDLLENYTPKEDIKIFLNDLPIKGLQFLPSKDQVYKLREYGYFELKKEYIYSNLRYDYDDVPRCFWYTKINADRPLKNQA